MEDWLSWIPLELTVSTVGYEWCDWGAGTELGGELSSHWVNQMLTGSDQERFSYSFNAAVRKSAICFAATKLSASAIPSEYESKLG